MTFKVFVDGQEGTVGLQINEYLAKRPDVKALAIEPERRKDPAARKALIDASDVTILCLPDAAARESVSLAGNERTCLIDASTAHRTDPAWAYGLPELERGQRERLRASKRIAVPGCHATGFVLLVHPLLKGGWIAPDHPLDCYSLTGYSGGGKKMIESYRTNPPPSLSSPRPYALGLEHKHLPEMRMRTGLREPPVFSPVVAAFYKGMAVSVFLHPARMARRAAPGELRNYLADYYAGERFVRVMPFGDESNLDGGFLDVQGCNGTNRADLFVFGTPDRLLLVARLDNLGKGAGGAAVQSMNIHLGVDEALGLG
jgi:N-acetyl-gamma-glutamyl-phosphate reductase